MKEWYRRLALILTVVLLAGSLVSCGSKDTGGPEKTASSEKVSKKDENSDFDIAGTYMIYRFGEGETQLDGDLLKASGMDKSYLKLDSDHTGVFVLSDTETPIEWNEDGEISTQGVVLYHFTIEGDVVNLDMMGNPIIFLRKGADAPDTLVASDKKETEAGEYISVQSAKGFDLYYAYQMAMGDDTYYDCLQMGMSPENTKLQVNNEGSVYVTMGGYETKFIFANGKVSTDGMDLYTYEVVSDDEIDLNMQGTIYRFVREDSDLAKSVGLTGDAVAGSGGVYIPNPGELEAEFEGGQLFYFDMNKFVEITYISTDQTDLYIPENIAGKEVRNVRRIGGTPENIYFPSCLTEVTTATHTDPMPSVKTITFGYGDNNTLALERVLKGSFDDFPNVETITFSGNVSDFALFSYPNFKRNKKLKEIIGGPERVSENLEFYRTVIEADPNSFLYEQPAQIKELAEEITKDANSDLEKLYEINKWVVYNIDYDIYPGQYTGYDGLGNPCVDVWLPLDVLDYRLTYCQGYSNLTSALCQAVGIPCVGVSGLCDPFEAGKKIGHQWNFVYLNGDWYSLDNTFDDCWKDAELLAKIMPTDEIHTSENVKYEELYPTPEDINLIPVTATALCVQEQPYINQLGRTGTGSFFLDPSHDSGHIYYEE